MLRTLVLSALLLALSCGDPAASNLHEPGASVGRAGGRSSSGDAGDGGSGESGSDQGGGASDGGDGSGAEGGDGSGAEGGDEAGDEAGAGGKAGEAGRGGSGGKPASCDEHFAAVNRALLDAQACNPETDVVHCTGTVQDLCGCPQPVERQESEATQAYQAAVKAAQDAGCVIFCTAILCIEPGPASCQPSGDSGRCTATGLGI